MYSVVRENFYDSGKLSRADKEMKEFHSIHAAQPGYRGNIVVDLGGGHMLIVTLWESGSTAHPAREALEPDIQRLLVPLMTKPSHLVGSRRVVVNDVSQLRYQRLKRRPGWVVGCRTRPRRPRAYAFN